MKARNVKGLDRDGSLADNAERIVLTRLDELNAFVPRALDAGESRAQHDMRIAAKRLRYLLELTAPCFGPYAGEAATHAKRLQEVLGEIHDCDELALLIAAELEWLPSGDPDRPGVERVAARLRKRRARKHERFSVLWAELEAAAFRRRLEAAVAERPAAPERTGTPDLLNSLNPVGQAPGKAGPATAAPGQAAATSSSGRTAKPPRAPTAP